MKLYRTLTGQWVGTQDDARKLAGKDWRAVEVPTDKLGLLAFLNAQPAPEVTERLPAPPLDVHDELSDAFFDAVQAQVGPVPELTPIAAHQPQGGQWGSKRATTTDAQRHAIDVEKAIADADLPTAIRLFDHVSWRLSEHVNAARALHEGSAS